MTPLYDSQEFYKKMLELQERLRKSEDERMKLEERFNLLSEDSRSRREACINKLRIRYIDYLEEQRLRDERNHEILGALDKIDGSLARITARTDRLGILRKQYEAYLLRVYANRSAGGGTGDSGVGSHNEDKSPKSNVFTQRGLTKNESNSSFIGPTIYPQSCVGASNISRFDVPKYGSGGQEAGSRKGQGDGYTIANDSLNPNLNLPSSCASKSQLNPNNSREFVQIDRNYPPISSANNLLRSNYSRLDPNVPQSSGRQIPNISDRYLEDPTSIRSRNFQRSSRDIRNADLQIDATNADFSPDLNNEAFGSYRHSTPLPGYLDYSSRYSRDPVVYETEPDLRHGFTQSDLEKVIQRNEQILPRDYLHNPETVNPAAFGVSQSSSLRADKQKTLDNDKPMSKEMNDDDLEGYINRIRSLHRENDQSLEAIDVEQNTSGDLLNATLSDDGPEQLTLHSDDKVKQNVGKIIPKDVKEVLALADHFVAETEGSFLNKEASNGREIFPKSVPNTKIYNDDDGDVANTKPTTFANLNDALPATAMLKSNFTSGGNLSISATRDDILSGTGSDDVNKVPATDASKFRNEITPPDSDVAILSNNKLAGFNETDVDEGSNVFNIKSNAEIRKVVGEERAATEVPRPKDLRKDIEGDDVGLIGGEEVTEKVIDVVRELEPPSLQHYEKNVVEIRVAEEDEKNINVGKVAGEEVETHSLQENPSSLKIVETHADHDANDPKYLEAGKIVEQSYDGLETEENKVLQYHEEPKYDVVNPSNEYQVTDDNQLEKNVAENIEEYRDDRQELQQNSEQFYDPGTTEQIDYDFRQTGEEQPYDTNQTYNADQRYETDPSQQLYAQEADPQFGYETNQHFEGDLAGQYANESNEGYEVDPNEQQYANNPDERYASDRNEEYGAGENEEYAIDPNAQYEIADPNEQYETDVAGQYANDANEGYAGDPNQQYGYYQDQPYQDDPNATYDNTGQGEYGFGTDDQGYENDPNQRYAAGEEEYLQQDETAGYEPVGYEESQQGDNQEFGNNEEPNYAGHNPEFESVSQEYQSPAAAAGDEQNTTRDPQVDSYVEELGDVGEIGGKEYSGDGKKKNKDVIRALLESDTESTIERNPSNNTESDFDFN